MFCAFFQMGAPRPGALCERCEAEALSQGLSCGRIFINIAPHRTTNELPIPH